MQTPATEIDQMIVQLNEFILPSSLMESFDVYREESVKSVARCFNDAQLSWFLDMLNRFRGPDDRKDSLVDIFDPGMYTCDHPAWDAAPGTRIEMPALTSEIARLVDRNSEFAEIAKRHPVLKLGPRERGGGRGEQHLSAVARGRHSGGAVHVEADVVRAGLGCRRPAFAGVHPHAYPHRRAVRECRGRQRPLGRGRGAHRLRGDRKNDKERVTLDADLEPAVLERLAEDARVRFEDVLVTVGAELGLEFGRALDVRE